MTRGSRVDAAASAFAPLHVCAAGPAADAHAADDATAPLAAFAAATLLAQSSSLECGHDRQLLVQCALGAAPAALPLEGAGKGGRPSMVTTSKEGR